MNDAIPLLPWRRPGYLESAGNRLTMDGVDLVSLTQKLGTPVYVFSERKLRANAAQLKRALSLVHDRTLIAYASKAVANRTILQIFRDEGLGVEVNSGGELFKALDAGFLGSQIVFNGVAKTETEIDAALAADIKAINVDSVGELERIAACAGRRGAAANVVLRVVPDIKGGGTAGLETGSAQSKFGMIEHEIVQALKICREAKDRLHFRGFHAHIGSQVNDVAAYRAEAEFMIRFLEEMKPHMPEAPTILNLGGGFPVSYVDAAANRLDPSFAETYSVTQSRDDLAAALIGPLRRALGDNIEFIVEPGRSLVADTAVMLTRVEAVKERGGRRWLYLDIGYGGMLENIFSWYFHMVTANRADDHETAPFQVYGPLCDSYDAFHDVMGEAALKKLLASEPSLAAHRKLLEQTLLHRPHWQDLPAATSVGDLIAMFDVGAYNIDTMSQYCLRLQPVVAMIGEDGTVRTIRRAETFDDLLAKDV